MITPVDLNTPETFDAPSWSEAFDQQHLEQRFIPAGDGWKTSIPGISNLSKLDLIEVTNPVLRLRH
eukprot:scaffold10199_cov146-Cylindrotheca_fusiformis.AAC.35